LHHELVIITFKALLNLGGTKTTGLSHKIYKNKNKHTIIEVIIIIIIIDMKIDEGKDAGFGLWFDGKFNFSFEFIKKMMNKIKEIVIKIKNEELNLK
jgi:hypothetical protein